MTLQSKNTFQTWDFYSRISWKKRKLYNNFNAICKGLYWTYYGDDIIGF